MDTMLPFGLGSTPKILTAVADGLELIVRRNCITYIEHYLDDFVILGPPQNRACQRDLDTVLVLWTLKQHIALFQSTWTIDHC